MKKAYNRTDLVHINDIYAPFHGTAQFFAPQSPQTYRNRLFSSIMPPPNQPVGPFDNPTPGLIVTSRFQPGLAILPFLEALKSL